MNVKAMDRHWMWKSAHRGQIKTLHQCFLALGVRFESLSNLVASTELKIRRSD
ncbi:hypothetical protein Plhal710r2_c005g0023201 [Plasmopara halstedii]